MGRTFDRFKEIWDRVRWLQVTMFAGATAAPLGLVLFHGPFLDQSFRVFLPLLSALTGAVEVAVCIIAFHFFQNSAKYRLDRYLFWFSAASGVLAIGLVLYLYCFFFPLNGVGYTVQAQSHQVRHPDYNVWQILEAFGNDESRVFEDWYLMLMRVGVVILWTVETGVWMFTLTLFVLRWEKDRQARTE